MTDNTWVLEMIRDRDCRTDAERDVMNMAINSVKTEQADEFIPKRTGHWIVHEHAEEFYGRGVDNYECDNCGDWYLNKTNFCPNCGCRMIEPQESEGKG